MKRRWASFSLSVMMLIGIGAITFWAIR